MLPITLQRIKDEFDALADSSMCQPDPQYNFDTEMSQLMREEGLTADQILVIRCPHCGRPSYYSGGFTDCCACCGFYNLADYSDEAMTLDDYWWALAEAVDLP